MLPGVTQSFERVAAAFADRYRLIRELGSGGMATVYLAEDVRHHRRVAVKVLRPELAATLGAERFTREIETAARFQHPHILPLLDSGQADGFLYYVMPYVEGESLRDRLAHHGELPIHDAVKILVEVVDALAYAHAHGVVHRDIKPDNVLLSGRHALVMDFGVAKALSEASAGTELTTAGVALGTPAYMAPEQAAAEPHIDQRADLYAVGVLGYELVTGGPPFVARTASEVLAAQVTQRPEPLEARRPACPPALAHILMKCLEKRPADRWQSADELLAELEPLATPSGGTTPTATRPVAAVIGTPLRRYVAVAVVLAAVVVGVVLLARPRPPAVALGRRVQVTLDPGLEIDPALSPDGKLLAYTAGSPGRMRLYVRQLEGGTPVPVVRGVGGFQRLPHWAPDGARLLFLSDRGIEIAPALGGAPRLLVPLAGATPGPISPDGRSFLYASGDSLYLRPLDGALARLIVTGLELHSFAWSPDGRWIAYVSGNKTFIADGTFGNLAPSSVWIVGATGGAPHRVTDDRNLNMSPVWMPQGRALLYVSNRDGGRDVYAVTVAASGASAGPPVRLTTGLNVHGISVGASGGLLAYSAFTETSNVWSLPIPSHAPLSVARARPVTSGNQTIEGFDVSPDGRWLAFDSNRNGVQQVFRVPLAGGDPAQLTNDSTDVFFPAYSPDGREIVFHGFRAGRRQVFVMGAAGGPAMPLTHVAGDERAAAWAPGGRRVAMQRDFAGPDPRLDIVTRDSEGRWSEPRSFSLTVRRGGGPVHCEPRAPLAWSPDGRWIAVTCVAGGTGLILVPTDGGPAQVLVPNSAGRTSLVPQWSPDSRTVYDLFADSVGIVSVGAVPVAGGAARVLVRFDDPSRPWHRYGFRARGGRFYFTVGDLESDIWVAELERRR
jgi:Tol biopolymer transport system component/tRNA A-37 threonylcarbamoyl transferase component Bud32